MVTFVLAGLYVFLSLVFALAVIKFISPDHLPALHIPKGLEQAAVGGVIIFSIISLLLTSAGVSRTFDYPLGPMFIQMVYGTAQGKGLLLILLCGAIWYGVDALTHARTRAVLLLIASCGLIVASSVSMHASTLSLSAFIAQTVHLFAVSFWLGLLFLVGWFAHSGDGAHWRSFLRWFTPAAIASVILVILSGLVLMNAFSSDWMNAWVLSYGQALLVKHLLFIPLIAFASMNGIWIRRRLSTTVSSSYDPRGWMKAESVMALAVFTAAAVLSQQAPPHNLSETLRYTPPSSWFLYLYDGAVTPEIHLSIIAQPFAVILFVVAVAFLGMTFLSYFKRMHPSIGLCTSILFVISGYLALMMSL